MDYDTLMNRARTTNEHRDQTEHDSGFASPRDNEPSEHLRTAMMAIECGIGTEDWTAVAEGQAMLEQVLLDIQAIEILFLKSIKAGAGGCVSYVATLYDIWHEYFKEDVNPEFIVSLREKLKSNELPQMWAEEITNG